MRVISIGFALVMGTAIPCHAAIIQATGTTSGNTSSDVAILTHSGSASDFYGGDESGAFMNYEGRDPIAKTDLIDNAAHLFLADVTDGRTLFVVYERPPAGTTTISADGALASNRGDFDAADYLVRDAPVDTHDVIGGSLVTQHEIPTTGFSDGYLAALDTKFHFFGDRLLFRVTSPTSTSSGLTSLVVYTGTDALGDPVWFELEAGDFSGGVTAELLIVPEPGSGVLALGVCALGVCALFVLPGRRRRSADRQ